MISKKSRPSLILAIAAVAATGVLLYTWRANADESPTPLPSPSPSSGGAAPGDVVLQTSGGKLTTLKAQTMLKTIGPRVGSAAMSGLALDGKFGPMTQQAVRDFQTTQKMPAIGMVNSATADALSSTYQMISGVSNILNPFGL